MSAWHPVPRSVRETPSVTRARKNPQNTTPIRNETRKYNALEPPNYTCSCCGDPVLLQKPRKGTEKAAKPEGVLPQNRLPRQNMIFAVPISLHFISEVESTKVERIILCSASEFYNSKQSKIVLHPILVPRTKGQFVKTRTRSNLPRKAQKELIPCDSITLSYLLANCSKYL